MQCFDDWFIASVRFGWAGLVMSCHTTPYHIINCYAMPCRIEKNIRIRLNIALAYIYHSWLILRFLCVQWRIITELAHENSYTICLNLKYKYINVNVYKYMKMYEKWRGLMESNRYTTLYHTFMIYCTTIPNLARPSLFRRCDATQHRSHSIDWNSNLIASYPTHKAQCKHFPMNLSRHKFACTRTRKTIPTNEPTNERPTLKLLIIIYNASAVYHEL